MRRTTRAMQMVSAAKMRKAQAATLASRAYSSRAWELVLNLAATDNPKADLLRRYPQADKVGILLLTTNRGLVGSLNSNLVSMLQKTIKAEAGQLETNIISYGRKGRDFIMGSDDEVLADFEKYDRSIKMQDIYPMAQFVSNLYRTGQYRKILIVYNHFISTLKQEPRVRQLLPFTRRVLHPAGEGEPTAPGSGYNYIFEPKADEVFEHLLPRIVESQIYQTVLESEAAEQSARMVMMKNATEAAGDLITHLTLAYNKLRQNKITTELAEITAGKIALEQ